MSRPLLLVYGTGMTPQLQALNNSEPPLTSSSEPGATGDAGSVIVRGLAGEGSAADWVKVIDGGLSTNAVEGEAGRIEVSADEVTGIK